MLVQINSSDVYNNSEEKELGEYISPRISRNDTQKNIYNNMRV